MTKKSKLLISVIGSTFILGTALTVTSIQINDALKIKDSGTLDNKTFSDEPLSSNLIDEKYPLVASQANGQNAYLSAKTGPIVYWGDKITSLDWFGAERWSVDMNKVLTSPTHDGDWKRAWFNWDYDRENDVLWILSAGNWRAGTNVNQKLIAIDVKTGNDFFNKNKSYKEIPFPKNMTDVRFLSVLKSGDVLMYGGARLPLNSEAYIYSKSEDKITAISYNFNDALNSVVRANRSFRWYFFNLISIGNNLNVAQFVQFPDGSAQTSSFDVYGILVNDNLQQVKNKIWDKPKLITKGLNGFNNKQTTPQRDYYYLTNGNVVTVLYNKLVLFDPRTTDIKVLKLTDDIKWVQSWTFDASDNLYFKYRNDTFIYKINTSNIQATQNDNLLSPITYFDIGGATTNNINSYSNNYVLYNVHGYTGQIMMINSIYRDDPNFGNITEDDKLKNQYGLAVAISENRFNQNTGDVKGLLNTDKAFLQAANFEIKKGVLENKLPSEITSNDFDYLNESFLTRNNERDEKGNLKYPRFTKTTIDDEKGKIEVEVNLDQIPWFVNNGQMPSDIAPKTLKFSSDKSDKISSRITWKDSNFDYDFKNTLPSKLTDEDVYRFDPFSINIQSQILSIGNVSYPNKKYEIVKRDDTTGNVTIKTTFQYLPLGVDQKQKNILTYSEEKEYKIFNKTMSHNLVFVGNGGEKEDIKNIPELKGLSESNLLPSSFNTKDLTSILKFINTDRSTGYPISKMTFKIIPNDIDGTIKITGSLPDGYYSDDNNKTFTKTYIGLNKISDYKFLTYSNPTNFVKKSKRPSEITINDVFNNFVSYSGYNSSNVSLELIPNDKDGILTIKYILSSHYNDSIGLLNGFTKDTNGTYYRLDVVSGFKTTEEYESQFLLKFYDDNDVILNEIKKYTPQQINQTLNQEGETHNNIVLKIGNKVIKSTKELCQALIKEKGSSISQIQTEPDINVYYNDPNGEITIKLTYKNVNNGEDLVFIQRFTGFARGNQVTTNDVFSFKTNSRLFSDNNSLKTAIPSSIKNDLLNKKIDIRDFINYHSGDYIKAIEENNYSLEIVANDIYGYLTIKISFDQLSIKDPKSLLSYTVTYNGFMTE
ncbi:lipoprotein 17-related variable surface protein [Malacoplasma iowae]|uniref:lipoprotein 17-related variable surface protein n=1 Tax=Malacoplasma iowae TaxID=2116 RepID=UPI003872A818|nr:lipoprotein 17-related variable surface protein [Malacoplasma iowae]